MRGIKKDKAEEVEVEEEEEEEEQEQREKNGEAAGERGSQTMRPKLACLWASYLLVPFCSGCLPNVLALYHFRLRFFFPFFFFFSLFSLLPVAA